MVDDGLLESGSYVSLDWSPIFVFPSFFHSTFICYFYAFVLRHHLYPLRVPCNAADGLSETWTITKDFYLCDPPFFSPLSQLDAAQNGHSQPSFVTEKIFSMCGRMSSPVVSWCLRPVVITARLFRKETFAFPLNCVFHLPLLPAQFKAPPPFFFGRSDGVPLWSVLHH